MDKSIVKIIVTGALLGAAAFFAPFFLIRAVFFILIVGALFRLFRRGRGHWGHFAFADRIRSMSEEEYAAFKNSHSCPPAMVAKEKK